MENKNKEYYTIDVLQILKALWHRAWLMLLCGILAAVVGFSIAAFAITPKYSSSVMLYVNNNSLSLGNTDFTISSSQISAARSLVKTYSVILESRTTLEKVIEKTGVKYNYLQLQGMIKARSANDTEIVKVTVKSTDPYEAAKIANGIAEVLPVRIAEIIDGASMEVVDSAVPNLNKVSPSITTYTLVAFLLGVFVVAIILAVIAIMDDTIHDEDYILSTYNYPILGKVPDLLNSGSKPYKSYAYYYKKRQRTGN